MQAQVQNLLLVLFFLFSGYILYRQNKKFRAEEKEYMNSSKLRIVSSLDDEEMEDEIKQIA
jgi:hypothetical protein